MPSNDWFETWFDSKYYHLLYSHRNEAEARAFIEKLLHNIELPKGAFVLDLACGKGRHARVIHQMGYQVTGLDLSANSIKEARSLCKETPVEFFVHDMRMPFRSLYYDAVLNLFTSFGYFEHIADEVKTLNAMKQALKPGGILVIDYLNANKVKKELPKNGEKEIKHIFFRWETKEEDGYVIKTIQVEDHGKTLHFKEKVRLILPEELNRMLQEQGLNIMHTFGNYQLQTFMPHQSERFIIVAQAKS